MKQNLDPKKLDASNVGNGVVLRLSNGTEQSAILFCFSHGGSQARFNYRTGPGRYDVQSVTIHKTKWGRFVMAILPTGTSFLVTGESPVPAAVV